MKYPCSDSSAVIKPYKKVPGDGWISITGFTVNTTACTMTFSVPPDPVVGLFAANPTTTTTSVATTSTVATTTAAATTLASTTIPQQPANQNSDALIAAVVVVIIIVVLAGAYLASRKSKGKKGKA